MRDREQAKRSLCFPPAKSPLVGNILNWIPYAPSRSCTRARSVVCSLCCIRVCRPSKREKDRENGDEKAREWERICCDALREADIGLHPNNYCLLSAPKRYANWFDIRGTLDEKRFLLTLRLRFSIRFVFQNRNILNLIKIEVVGSEGGDGNRGRWKLQNRCSWHRTAS